MTARAASADPGWAPRPRLPLTERLGADFGRWEWMVVVQRSQVRVSSPTTGRRADPRTSPADDSRLGPVLLCPLAIRNSSWATSRSAARTEPGAALDQPRRGPSLQRRPQPCARSRRLDQGSQQKPADQRREWAVVAQAAKQNRPRRTVECPQPLHTERRRDPRFGVARPLEDLANPARPFAGRRRQRQACAFAGPPQRCRSAPRPVVKAAWPWQRQGAFSCSSPGAGRTRSERGPPCRWRAI